MKLLYVAGVLWILLLPFIVLTYSPETVIQIQQKHSDINATQTIQYVSGDTDLPEMPDAQAEHMQDVQQIVTIFTILFLVLTGALILDYGVLIKPGFLYSIGGGVIAARLIYTGLDFTHIFEGFHRLLFPPGTYTFDTSSYLIQRFPEPFFIAMLETILTIWTVTFIALTAFALLRNQQRTR